MGGWGVRGVGVCGGRSGMGVSQLMSQYLQQQTHWSRQLARKCYNITILFTIVVSVTKYFPSVIGGKKTGQEVLETLPHHDGQ